jgi:hypothetical protein
MKRRTSRKPIRKNSRRRTSRGLRRNSSTYYSVHIPYSKTPTEWHPTTKTGPFSTLSRGKFSTVQEAHDWAREHLGYKPVYKVVPHTLEENSRARYTRDWRQIGGSHRDPADQGTNPEGLTWNEWRAAAGTGGLTTAVLLAAWRAGEDPTEYRAMRKNFRHAPRLGSGERFAALVAKIRSRGGAYNPRAVAAAIGRRKYGSKRFQQLAAAGRRRSRRLRASLRRNSKQNSRRRRSRGRR